jgi:nucleoside 2-deoxyribosyltransferase
MQTNKIKIYLIARISEDAHAWNNEVASIFDRKKFEVFCPHKDNPWDDNQIRHEEVSQLIVDVDVEAISDSHFGLALPLFGRDCAWECGYYAGIKKPVVVFIEKETEWFRDWMVKGGINYVVTNNQKTFQLLKKDSILCHKEILLIEKMSDINETLISIYQKHYVK